MAQTKALLRQEIATRADMLTPTSTTFVNITECDQWIDEAMAELYGILIQVYPDAYSATQSYTVGSTAQITPPAGFYKIRAIDKDPGTTFARAIPRLNFAERYSTTQIRYRDLGSVIEFFPIDRANGINVQLWYVPTLTLLTSLGADTLDAIMDQYREFIILECAARAKEKDSEPDVAAAFRARKAEIERRLIEQIPEDAGQPEQVSHTFGVDGVRSFDFGPA